MATLRITVKDSRFVSHAGVKVEKDTSTFIEGNGWRCYIDDRGNICCIADKVYSGISHRIKFTIKNGWVKTLHRIGKGYYTERKSYHLHSDSTDGVIGLPSGRIDERRPYFREAAFQEFLDSNSLTSVRCSNPNGTYFLCEQKNSAGEVIFKDEIEATDGEMNAILKDSEGPDGENMTIIHVLAEVTNATWMIRSFVHEGEKVSRTLFTEGNPKEIPNLPT